MSQDKQLIYEALPAIMMEVPKIEKEGEGTASAGQRWDKIAPVVQNLFGKHGITIGSEVTRMDMVPHEETKPGNNGQGSHTRTKWVCTLTMRFCFAAKDGSSICVEAPGHGHDYSDKAAAKATTNALKYALKQALLLTVDKVDIPTREEMDQAEDAAADLRIEIQEASTVVELGAIWNRMSQANRTVLKPEFSARKQALTGQTQEA